MATKMVDMGIKRKTMHGPETTPGPKSEKDYDNEKVYPEMNLSGPHAESMGAEDLKAGDVVEQKVRWRVKNHSKTSENGKDSYSMTLCLEKAGDHSDVGEKDGEGKGDAIDDGSGADDSPAMSYIQGRAARE